MLPRIAMPKYHFEDFPVGRRFETESLTVSEADILDFARRFDPQYFHADPDAAKAGPFGGIIASGFHTLSASFSLFFRLHLVEHANLGSPGMEEVRWLRPLRPGDTIHMVAEVTEQRPSQSRPDRGLVWMRHDTFNQRGELIMTANCLHLLRRAQA